VARLTAWSSFPWQYRRRHSCRLWLREVGDLSAVHQQGKECQEIADEASKASKQFTSLWAPLFDAASSSIGSSTASTVIEKEVSEVNSARCSRFTLPEASLVWVR
jgi:hypothetical protein